MIMRRHRQGREERPDMLPRSVRSVNEKREEGIGIEVLCEHLAGGFEEYMNVGLIAGELQGDEQRLKEELLRTKYCRPQWNMKGIVVK